LKIVSITWDEDPDRGIETFGPFSTDEKRLEWIEDCQEAASLGRNLLDGATYRVYSMQEPFDPRDLGADMISTPDEEQKQT